MCDHYSIWFPLFLFQRKFHNLCPKFPKPPLTSPFDSTNKPMPKYSGFLHMKQPWFRVKDQLLTCGQNPVLIHVSAVTFNSLLFHFFQSTNTLLFLVSKNPFFTLSSYCYLICIFSNKIANTCLRFLSIFSWTYTTQDFSPLITGVYVI